MNSIELQLNSLMQIYRLAALGKVIGGLIHNLNGPLQNLGLSMEMTAYSIKNDSQLNKKSAQNILERIEKMEEEFDKVDRLIRISSSKTNSDDNLNNYQQLDLFLNQELYFLQTNLYFKHKVQADLNIQNNLPLIRKLPQDSLTGLCWFLQALVDDLEIREIESIVLDAFFDNPSIIISFQTCDKPLSDSVIECINMGAGSYAHKFPGDIDMGLWLSLMIFYNCDIPVKGLSGPDGSKITITIPVRP